MPSPCHFRRVHRRHFGGSKTEIVPSRAGRNKFECGMRLGDRDQSAPPIIPFISALPPSATRNVRPHHVAVLRTAGFRVIASKLGADPPTGHKWQAASRATLLEHKSIIWTGEVRIVHLPIFLPYFGRGRSDQGFVVQTVSQRPELGGERNVENSLL